MQIPPTEPSKKHDPYAAFRLSSFRRYFTGHTILILGWQMQKVAVLWEIYERTDSAMHLGYVGLVQFAPFAMLAVLAGHVTDTHNRKHILMTAAAFNAMAAAGLAWNSVYGTANLTYLFLLLGGCARAFQMPARRSFLPRIVPRQTFPNAVSWHSSGFELSSMAGPAVGGSLIAIFESATPIYLINSVVLAIFVILVAGIPYVHEKIQNMAMSLESLLGGFRFIQRSPVVFAAITLDMMGVLFGGAVALMPIFARDILEVGPQGLGWLMAAPAVGAFSMALLQAHMRPARQAGRRLLIAVTGFGLVTIGFGLVRNLCVVPDHAVFPRGLRQHQRGHSRGSGSDVDAGPHAGPRLGDRWTLHRDFERTGGVRVGDGGRPVRPGDFSRQWRGGNNCGRPGGGLDLASTAPIRGAGQSRTVATH